MVFMTLMITMEMVLLTNSNLGAVISLEGASLTE